MMMVIHAIPHPVGRVYFLGPLMLSLTIWFALVSRILVGGMMQARVLNGLKQFGLAFAFQWARAMRKACPGNYCPFCLFAEQIYM